tara:strand:- start:292 stop:1194 length:903 start_codon:yes stop_codon:yes gene_type:complete
MWLRIHNQQKFMLKGESMYKVLGLFIALFFLNACETENKKFTKLSSGITNVSFKNKLYETNTRNYFTNPYMYLGAGVAAGDFNNDGLEDLFFLGNMVPNKLYINQGNLKFNDISESAGIEGDDRWYSGVTLIDINNDGFLDIYCSVGGENGPNNNILFINNQDNTFTEKAEESLNYEITSFHSIYLENKNGVFRAKPLNYQAQFSNINSIVVKDIDSDGNLDAILAGNLYNAEVETPRNDASYGIWLKGDGKGGFKAILPRESGLVMRGDVRNMKIIKVKEETHLLVAKNNEALQQIKIN